MTDPTQLMRLCRQIELAFDDTPSINSSDAIISTTLDDDGVADQFRGTTWKSHAVQTLRRYQCAFSRFTDGAFRYFLPGFMLAELKDPVAAEQIRDFIATRLENKRSKQMLEQFTDPELWATAAFLEECIHRYHYVGGEYGKAHDVVEGVIRERERSRRLGR